MDAIMNMIDAVIAWAKEFFDVGEYDAVLNAIVAFVKEATTW